MSDTIEMTVWVRRGKMLVRRDALDPTDQDHPYNYVKSLGYNPEDFGIEKPHSTCPNCGMDTESMP